MEMKSYQLYNGHVDLVMSNGNILRLWLNEWSGKIVFRYKIDTISDVTHPGIVLGYDQVGTRYIIHNHFEHGKPVIEPQSFFSKGQELFMARRQSSFETSRIIQNGLNEVLWAKRYNWITNNCQCFVNRVCHNENKSEAVENWTGGILTGLLLIAGIKALNNSK
jgi:hypothetical protein